MHLEPTPDSLRVALFTDTFLPKVDGIVTVICLLLDHLAARGVTVAVFAPGAGARTLTDYHGIPIYSAPSLPFPFYPDLRMGWPSPALWRDLRAFDPQVIHFVHPSVFGFFSYALARRYPALVSFHIDYGRVARHFRVGPFHAGIIEPPINFLTRRVMNSADYNLAPSRLVQARLREIGVTAEIGLWRRGVDAERFHPRYRREDWRQALAGGQGDDVILLYVGRLSPEKQLHHLQAVLDAVPGTRLALVGDGPARAALRAQLDPQRTQFLGYLQGADLAAAYASADIFVFPSALESFGLVVVEAMASGLPVVAAQVGGVRDVIAEGHSGFTFAPGDVAALVAAVRTLAADPARRAAMGAAARAFAVTQTWPAMMDEVIDHYRRLANRNRADGQ